MLGEELTGDIGTAEKKFSINFSKANTKLCLSFYHIGDNSSLFVNGKNN